MTKEVALKIAIAEMICRNYTQYDCKDCPMYKGNKDKHCFYDSYSHDYKSILTNKAVKTLKKYMKR